MKKQILALTTAFLLTTSIAFANDATPVPQQIVNELNREFKDASNVEWKTTANFYKASFTAGNQPLEVFYSFEGERIGISRNISINQLPMSLLKEAHEKASAAQVTDLFELLTDKGTEYFITVGSGKDQKTYKSSGVSWSRYQSDTLN